MHQSIRHSLEDFLRGGNQKELPAEFQAHLGECAECANELRVIEEQSQLLRSLRNSGEIEPRAGFYARVVDRIQQQPASIWSVFLERRFGFRLAVGSAALVALLAAYLVTSEAYGPEFSAASPVAFTGAPRTTERPITDAPEDGAQQQQERDAVLVNLASYRQ